jgi:hypothetical protein
MNESVQLPWPSHPEDHVIGKLLKSSDRFRAFYQAERQKIVGDVYWAHDTNMPKGIDYRNTVIVRAGVPIARVIRLRRVPATSEDAFKIAHELEHLVLDAEGFGSTHPIIPDRHPFFRSHELLSSALNSMLIDPVVDSRLQGHGFDLQADYEREVKEDICQLSRFTSPPSDRLDNTRWMFNYVDKLLYWELLDTQSEHSVFQEWFDARFPQIASKGKKLFERIKRTGYDTSEKQSRLFAEIIQRYRLNNILAFP